MVATPEGVIDKSPNVPLTSTKFKKLSARKSLCLFTNILNVRTKTGKLRIVAANPNVEPLKLVITCGQIKQNKKGIKNQ